MKGTFTPTYRVKVPFMRIGMGEGFPSSARAASPRRQEGQAVHQDQRKPPLNPS
jgi:hypothetical protein